MKGIPFVNRKYTKGKQASSVEKVYKRVTGWTCGRASPYKTLLSTSLEASPKAKPNSTKVLKIPVIFNCNYKHELFSSFWESSLF